MIGRAFAPVDLVVRGVLVDAEFLHDLLVLQDEPNLAAQIA